MLDCRPRDLHAGRIPTGPPRCLEIGTGSEADVEQAVRAAVRCESAHDLVDAPGDERRHVEIRIVVVLVVRALHDLRGIERRAPRTAEEPIRILLRDPPRVARVTGWTGA